MSRRHDGDAHALCQSQRPRDAVRASFFRRRRVSNALGRSRLTLGVRAFGRALKNGESLANTGLFRVRAAEREDCRTPPRAAAAERRGGPGGPDSGPRIKNARKPA